MAGFRMDADVVVGYARTTDSAAAELANAAAALQVRAFSGLSVGPLGEQLGVPASYERAAAALRRQLTDGADALRSASDALHKVTENQGGGDGDAASRINRILDDEPTS
jgi:hypothetical protein